MRTILWLERQMESPSIGTEEGIEVDYDKVVQLIKRYTKIKAAIAGGSLPPSSATAVKGATTDEDQFIQDDDDAFPSSEDDELDEADGESDISESQFVDARERSALVKSVRMSDSVAARRKKKTESSFDFMQHSTYGGATVDG